jgi:hypothetical protein
MDANKKEMKTQNDALSKLVFVNAILWILSVIALIFIMQNSSSVKGLFVILASGVAVGVTIVSSHKKCM